MKANLIVSDLPFGFFDQLQQDPKIKRSAKANYSVMSNKDMLELKVADIAADDCLIAFWCPSTHLEFGLQCLRTWGFEPKQTVIWVKVKKEPLKELHKLLKKTLKLIYNEYSFNDFIKDIFSKNISDFDISNILYFGMGSYFRQTHEVVLIGVKGKVASQRESKSLRSVFFAPIGKHSEKPEILQDDLEKMFGKNLPNRLELFSRRDRPGWKCFGNQCPSSMGEDVRDSIEKYKKY